MTDRQRRRQALATALAAGALSLAGCTAPSSATTAPSATTGPSATTAPAGPRAAAGHYTHVIVIPEENHTYGQVIGSSGAPYLNTLASTYGLATNYTAGYPTALPSLPGYLIWLQGKTGGATTDCVPTHCPQSGNNLLHQLSTSGRQWQMYAESMPSNCYPSNTADYVPRHAPAPYFTDERANCQRLSVPFAGMSNALSTALAAGSLPPFTMVTPNLQHDMHDGTVGQADSWLRAWIPKILAGKNNRAGNTVVIIAWDEGSHSDNHVPLIVISPTTKGVRASGTFTHYSLARTLAEIVGVAPLNQARSAASMTAAFNLDR